MHKNEINYLEAEEILKSGPADSRVWFLRDSAWNDAVWIFAPTNVLEESKTLKIYWNFQMPEGGQFTDDFFGPLLETSRKLVALVRTHSLGSGLAQRVTTTLSYFGALRTLVQWMSQNGFRRFKEIDEQSLYRYQEQLKKVVRAPTTLIKYLHIFIYLHKFRDRLEDGLQFAPFSGRTLHDVAGVRESEIPRMPYTPDSIAIPLIQRSIELISQAGDKILAARDIYTRAVAEARQRGLGLEACTHAATRAIRIERIVLPGLEKSIQSVSQARTCIDMLYAACFVVIAYLVGARASEILHLRAGCVQKRETSNGDITVIVGAIYKRQPEYHGRPHEWVAPPAAVKAVVLLEALSAPHRERNGTAHLWLRRARYSGATEWHSFSADPLKLCSSARIRDSLVRLSRWLELPQLHGKTWVLTTHQGRKTFARFAALRDRSALFALAQHFGHRERAVTDQGYSGLDYRLNDEIDQEILAESVLAWEHMLATPGLGGKAGAEIMKQRPRFKGARLKEDIKSYARMLVDAGLVLGICDWGFCVYRENSSACLGNVAGPNPVRREQSTCARCANYAVSEKHRSYWIEQVRQSELLLDDTALPLQTLRLARERLHEAKVLIRSIDTLPKKEE